MTKLKVKKISLPIIFSIVLTSCVSSSLYKELDYKYKSAQKESRLLLEENNDLMDFKTELTAKVDKFEKQIENSKGKI